MNEQFSRTQMLLGEEAMQKLQKARVIVFGVGGVGGYTVEALARCGFTYCGVIVIEDGSERLAYEKLK